VTDAYPLEVLVALGLAVLGLTLLARTLRVTPPVVLLLGGVALAFVVPPLADVQLPPEVVLLLFLPALLYWEALNTSLREIRSNLRAVLFDAVLLVLATAGVVAVLGHALGLSWPVAWILGAVVAPTDATAVAAIARRLPRRQLTTLRAESLINDGTALALFAIAVDVATGAVAFGWLGAVGGFVLSYAGGVVAGLVVAWLASRVRRILHDPLLDNTVSVLTPFVAFLIAEEVHASGVLAVVVSGLAMSQIGPLLIAAQTRLRARAFWQVSTFLLNGSLFVLVGLQLRGAVEGLVTTSVAEAVAAALLVSLAVIGTRLAWMYTVPYLVRVVDRRPAQRARRLGARHRFPIAWSGFRGGISLAAALAVPPSIPGRDLIVVVTFGVILVTLLLHGLTLPAVLRWARLPEDHDVAEERRLAEQTAVEAALAALPAAVERLHVPAHVADRVRDDFEQKLADLEAAADEDADDPPDGTAAVRSDWQAYRVLKAALIADKRAAVVRLRDARVIDDIVLRSVEARLDAEEMRLATPADPE
jgi:CPA1 family monovalent cation:H+ antiporter